MLAVLTPEQKVLQDVAKRVTDSVAIRNPSDLEGHDQETAWSRLVDAGALGLRARDEGAPLASGTELRLFAEATGAALVPVPFVGVSLAIELLAGVEGTDELIDSIASGETRWSIALRSDLSGLATPEDESVFGWDVQGAEYVVALGAASGGKVEVLKVAVDAAATVSSPLDGTRTLAPVSLAGAEVVGTVDNDHVTRWEALALSLVSADAVGAMRQALDNAIEYSKERTAYGQPIGSFQALQHLMVEAYIDLQPAAALTTYAAWAVDELEPAQALLAARSAKAYVGRVGIDVVERAMQVFGGVGVTREHIAHFFTRRVMVDRMLFGPEDTHFEHIANARLGGN